VRYREESTESEDSRKTKHELAIENFKQSIIYKDERIVIINKPRATVAHSGTKHEFDNLETLLQSMPDKETGEPLRLVHRLDKDTTGCLILARTKEAAANLHKLFTTESNPISRRVNEPN
jgi:23S rRNA pseudouridine955/2504/2580 synthase